VDIPAVDMTGSLADGKTAFKSLYDGDTSTYLRSSAKGWQYVQFDFGCEVDLYKLRRYMTQDGKRAPLITMHREYEGARENQGVCCGY
jgi:hypothetical protein